MEVSSLQPGLVTTEAVGLTDRACDDVMQLS